ncbi:MAG TPA: hypothetical protein VF041_12890 [Gemmatimonadaceae bacterium]
MTIATEAAVGLAIPDAVARELTTPRQVIDHLATRLPSVETVGCRTRRAFYRVQGAMARRFDRVPTTLTPDTPIAEVLPASARDSHWRQLGAELGADSWPRFRDATRVGRHFGWGLSMPDDVARYLALQPAAEVPPHAKRGSRK